MSFITSPGVIIPPLTAGGVAYGTGGQAKVNNAGTVGQVLVSGGAGVPTFSNASTVAVTSFSGASTGLTPATATTGAVSLAGTLAVGSGGTSLTTLTANNVILGNGASAPTFVAPGASGNLLTSNGTTWQSTALAVSASGLTLVQTVNASSGGSTVIVNGFSASYNNYKLIISDLFPSADLRNFELKFYINSVLISLDYQYAYQNVSASGASSNVGSLSNDTIRLANAMDQSVLFNRSNQYEVDFYAVNGTSTFKSITYNGVYHFASVTYQIIGAGTQTVTSGKLTGVEFTFPGSTFGGGKFQLYGYAPT